METAPRNVIMVCLPSASETICQCVLSEQNLHCVLYLLLTLPLKTLLPPDF